LSVRRAGPGDVAALVRVLAAAFHDDPGLMHLIPGDARRRLQLPRFWRSELRRYLPFDEVHTTEAREGVAVWAPPGRWRRSPLELARATPANVRVFGARLPVAVRSSLLLESKHPRAPHWHLWALATDPARRGRGVATAVLGPVLRRCDDSGVPAYLETAREGNVPFYRRFGFDVVERVTLPAGGPPLWLMLREPAGSTP
jgi:GNAT superfamily N-acetyltransferase